MSALQQRDIDTLIARFYAAFDNREGKKINIPDLRDMFLPEARITRVATGKAETWSVEEFITPRAAMLADGTLVDFHEWEIEASTTIFNNIAERHSRYRKSGQLRGEPYSGEGRKFILLCHIEGRCRIVSILWEDL